MEQRIIESLDVLKCRVHMPDLLCHMKRLQIAESYFPDASHKT